MEGNLKASLTVTLALTLSACTTSSITTDVLIYRLESGRDPLVRYTCRIKAHNTGEQLLWLIIPSFADSGLREAIRPRSFSLDTLGDGMRIDVGGEVGTGNGGFHAYPVPAHGTLVIYEQTVYSMDRARPDFQCWVVSTLRLDSGSDLFHVLAVEDPGVKKLWEKGGLPKVVEIASSHDWKTIAWRELDASDGFRIHLEPVQRVVVSTRVDPRALQR